MSNGTPNMHLVATSWRMDAAIHLYDGHKGVLVCGTAFDEMWVITSAEEPTCRGCSRAFARANATHPLDR